MQTGLHVLIVEDNDIVRSITTEYLQELGCQAMAVASAEEALKVLEERSFEVLLTDLRLPGMSGVALAKLCAARFPGLAIVVTSGYGELSAELFSAPMRAKIFMLPKPFDLDELRAVLDGIEHRRSRS